MINEYCAEEGHTVSSRDWYERDKAKRVDELEWELQALDVRREKILQTLELLAEETFEEFDKDARYDEWRAKQAEV